MITLPKIEDITKSCTYFHEITDYGSRALMINCDKDKKIFTVYVSLRFNQYNTVSFIPENPAHYCKTFYQEFKTYEEAEFMYRKKEPYTLKNQIEQDIRITL